MGLHMPEIHFQDFTFSSLVSLGLSESLLAAYNWAFFFFLNHLASLCLLIGDFKPLTSGGVIDGLIITTFLM